MKLTPSLDMITVLPEKKSLYDFVQMLGKMWRNLAQLVNGNVTFGDGTNSDNINGTWINTTTPVAPNTDFTVDHNLGRIPAGYLVMEKDRSVDVYTGSVPATNTQLTLRATVASAVIRLFVLTLLFTFSMSAQTTTTVSGIITDAGGQTWNNGSITFTFNQAGTFPPYFNDGVPYTPVQISSGLDSGGAFSVAVPSNSHITPVGTKWGIQVCPQASGNCFVLTTPITISGTTMNISAQVIPPAIVISPIPGASAYLDSEVNATRVGSLYYNLISTNYRLCTVVVANVCTVWINLGGSGPGGATKWNDLLNPNGNLSPNFGGATFTFANGFWNFGSMSLQLPSTSGFVPTLTSQIGYDTFNNNLLFFGNASNYVGLIPTSQTINPGDLASFSFSGNQLTLAPITTNASSGTTIIETNITNPKPGDTQCITSLGPPIVWENCSPGVPVNVQSGTSYTVDCVNDRGTYIIFTAATTIAVTLPQAAASGNCDANFFVFMRTINANAVITPTTSTINDGGGATSSSTISPGYGIGIFSDDANYFAKVSPYREGANPLFSTEGIDIGPTGRFQWQEANGSPATVLNKMVCLIAGVAKICPAASSTTNNPDGIATVGIAAAPGSTGNVPVCSFGFCTIFFDNAATSGHYAQLSSTVDGDLHDIGASVPTNGQAFWHIWTSNSGANTTGVVRIVTSDELNAAGSNGNGKTTVQVNGSQTQPQANFITGGGITWSKADSGNTSNITATINSQYKILVCETGLGDGLNAMAAGTYLQFFCVNRSGVTWTITGINCWTDNNGTSTLNAANNASTGLLTGAVTCTNTKSGGGAAGTQSGTTTLANNDAISFTFVADGTSKQTTWTVSVTQ